MDIELLKELVLFEKMGTLSKTAEILHTTQPTISRNLQKLEYELNVSLFEKRKNKLTLNENGKLAVEYARVVLRDYEHMKEEVKAFSEKRITLAVGSCAPLPSGILIARLSFSWKDNVITSNLEEKEEKLIESLKDGTYQIIILPYPLKDTEVVSRRLCSEKLFVRCKKEDKLASLKSVTFKEINGRTFLLNKTIGVWRKIVDQYMPQSQFLVQEDSESVNKIFEQSSFLTFGTDLGEKLGNDYGNCVKIPIMDSVAKQTFYYCYLKKDSEIFDRML